MAMGALEKVLVFLPVHLLDDELVVGANCVSVVLFCRGEVLSAKIALIFDHRLKLWMFCCSVLFQQQHCDEDLVAVTAHVSDIVALRLDNVRREADRQWLRGLLGCHRLHCNPVVSSHCDYCLLNLLNPDIFPILLLVRDAFLFYHFGLFSTTNMLFPHMVVNLANRTKDFGARGTLEICLSGFAFLCGGLAHFQVGVQSGQARK